MDKLSHETGPRNFREQSRFRTTCGETLADGAVTDLLTARDRNGLDVVLSHRQELHIGPQVNHDGTVYLAPSLDQSILDAIPFPTAVAESDSSDSLFEDASGVYRDRLGLPADLAAFFTTWNFTSWTPELMPTPVTLGVTAMAVSQGINLFRLFGPLGRRSLIVAKLSRQLPLTLRPTLLIADQMLSAKDLAFWRVCNSHRVYVPGTRRSTICELACSRAVLLRPDDSPDDWGDQVMHVLLPAGEFPPLSERELEDIAQEFQPRFERHRLRVLTQGHELSSQSPLPADSDLARTLLACVRPKAEIVQLMAPLLESHEQERVARRLRNPRVAVVEALWIPAHAPGKMRVSEIARRVDVILRNRGEIYEHNAWELGWMLKKMRLPTHRDGSGQVVQFSSEIRHRLHQLAREFQLRLPTVQDCPDCTGPKVTEQSLLV